jgi:hypothetical protein
MCAVYVCACAKMPLPSAELCKFKCEGQAEATRDGSALSTWQPSQAAMAVGPFLLRTQSRSIQWWQRSVALS